MQRRMIKIGEERELESRQEPLANQCGPLTPYYITNFSRNGIYTPEEERNDIKPPQLLFSTLDKSLWHKGRCSLLHPWDYRLKSHKK